MVRISSEGPTIASSSLALSLTTVLRDLNVRRGAVFRSGLCAVLLFLEVGLSLKFGPLVAVVVGLDCLGWAWLWARTGLSTVLETLWRFSDLEMSE